MLYDPDTLTDQPVREIAAEIIREKALICLREEVPHGIAVTVERYHEREDGLTEIEASLICEKDSHKGIIIGRGGSMLKRIGTLSRRELEELTGGRAYLKLFVKVRKDWRDNELMLKHFGYSRKDL
jgi:GTP-binding protein Era